MEEAFRDITLFRRSTCSAEDVAEDALGSGWCFAQVLMLCLHAEEHTQGMQKFGECRRWETEKQDI